MTMSDSVSNTPAVTFKREEVDLVEPQWNPTSSRISEFEKIAAGDFSAFAAQDDLFQKMIAQAYRQTLVAQDPCTIPDDLREELMRQKRKDDAFKTALCDSFRRNQTCSYGEQCRFAHGVTELRLPQNPRGRNHPKYKTVLCDKFSTTGTCKYGTRCQFIHKFLNPTAGTGALHNTTTTQENALNKSMFMSSSAADQSMDLNNSLPVRRTDVARAFSRFAQFGAIDGMAPFISNAYTFQNN